MTQFTRTIVTTLSVGLAAHLGAQGFSYDVATSGTDPRSGSTQVMATSHGRWTQGRTRIDVVTSPARGGMMGAGSYIIAVAATGITTVVDPDKHQFYEMDSRELGAQAAQMQSAIGGVAKMEIVDVQVHMDDLGAGETIEGYATLKYRLTQSYTMRMTILGHNRDTKEQSVSDIWVAPELSADLNPGSRPAAAAGGMMQPLTDAVAKAYTQVKPGVMLRMMSTSVVGEGSKARNRSTTMNVSNVKHESFAASVFQVPSGYARIDSPLDALGAGRKP